MSTDMEAGEKELRQVFEETTTNNVKAVVAHSNETRRLIREQMDKVVILEGIVRNQDKIIENIKLQLAVVQTKVFSGGT